METTIKNIFNKNKKWYLLALVIILVALFVLLASLYANCGVIINGGADNSAYLDVKDVPVYDFYKNELGYAATPNKNATTIPININNKETFDLAGIYQFITEEQVNAVNSLDNYLFSYLALSSTRGIFIKFKTDGTGYKKRFEDIENEFTWEYLIVKNKVKGIIVTFLEDETRQVWQIIENKDGSTYFDVKKLDEDLDRYGESFKRIVKIDKQETFVVVTDNDGRWIPIRREFMWSETQHVNKLGIKSTLCADGGQLGFLDKEGLIASLYKTTSIENVFTYGNLNSSPFYTVYDAFGDDINLVGTSGDSLVYYGEELILPKEAGEYIVGISVVWDIENGKSCDKCFFKYVVDK